MSRPAAPPYGTPRAQLIRLGWRPAWTLLALSVTLHLLTLDTARFWHDGAYALAVLASMGLGRVRPAWGVALYYAALAPLLIALANAENPGWALSPDYAGYSAALVLPAATAAVYFGFRGVATFLAYGLGLGALFLPFSAGQLTGLVWNVGLGLGLGWAAAWLLNGADQALAELRRTALQDPLTGLGNRRAFDDALDVAWSAEGDQLALALMDLDGLKALNDARGHAAGDALLRGFATELQTRLGPGETAYRLGGDEYVVLCSADRVEPVLTAVRQAVTRMHQAGFLEMGASVGTATAAEARSSGALVRLADERMYIQKRAQPQRRTGL